MILNKHLNLSQMCRKDSIFPTTLLQNLSQKKKKGFFLDGVDGKNLNPSKICRWSAVFHLLV